MSIDLEDQVQAYTEFFVETIDPVELVEIVGSSEITHLASPRNAGTGLEGAGRHADTARPTRVPARLPGPAVAVAAAAVIIIAIGVVIAVRLHAPTPPPVVTTPPPTTLPAAPVTTLPPTTTPPPTTTASPTDVDAGQADVVNDLAIASDGHLWAATMAGVVRWDPAASTLIVFSETDGLVDRRVEHIDVAADGTVWVAGASWVARFDGTWTVVDRDLPAPIGDIAAGPDGTAWVTAGMDSLVYIDEQGTTKVQVLPEETGIESPWMSLAVGADGTLWANVGATLSDMGFTGGGILAFDGEWHHYGVDDGLPDPMTGSIAVAPDGSVWAGNARRYSGWIPGYLLAAGIARFDGTTWTSFTTADGLLSNNGDVAVGSGGDVWVIHEDLPTAVSATGSGLSRYDGTRWNTYPDITTGDGDGAAVSADGTLWMFSEHGIVGFDGTASRMLVAGTDAVPPLGPPGEPISLEPVETFDPLATSIGTIEFTSWRLPEGWENTVGILAATTHGVVLVTPWEQQLMWSLDGVTWSEIPVSVEPGGFTSDGDDLIVYGIGGAVRLTWDGTRWVEEERLGIDGAWQVVAGSHGMVATTGTQVFYSTDGVEFHQAEGDIAPVDQLVATDDGFIALTSTAPGRAPLVWFSVDGTIWEQISEESPFGPSAGVWPDIATRDGRLVAPGWVSFEEEGAVWVSDDGLSWEPVDVQLVWVDGVAAGARGWILLGNDGETRMWVSTDGITWDGPYETPGGWTGYRPLAALLDDRVIGYGQYILVGKFLDD